MKITVLGAGSVGHATAGYLGMNGHNVCLFEFPRFKENIEQIQSQGGIEVTGAAEGFGKVDSVTTDIKKAINGAEIIMVVIPGYAYKEIALACAPHINESQIVVISPSTPFGALEFSNTLKEAGNHESIIIADTSNTFACRKVEPGKVRIMGIRKKISVAAVPKNKTNIAVEKLKNILDGIEASSIIEIALNNNSLIVHPAPAILNAGWIESTNGGFDFYWKGMSPSVCKVMEAVDQERIEVGKALGYEPISFLQSVQTLHGEKATTLHEYITTNPMLGGPKIGNAVCPSDLNYRYISEDVPYGFVPYSELGKVLGVPTPFMDSLILLASQMNDLDYREEGRNLKRMGIKGNAPEVIKEEILC